MKTYIHMTCSHCKKDFKRTSSDHKKWTKISYCSKSCHSKGQYVSLTVKCNQCDASFIRCPAEYKKSITHFCSRSCSATYNNTHKTKGTRISKLEMYLAKELVKIYPTIEFHFNRKDTINSELDIYIPSLKLAFELNGIFHYEPIYGEDKLKQIQNNDNRKFQACLEHHIELVIIDSSKMKNFKEKEGQLYLKIITDIIDLKLA